MFTFFGNLRDFLPAPLRGIKLEVRFEGHESLKHLIEALGVPHVEVGQALANGNSVDLSYNVHDGDLIEVHPLSDEELEQGRAGPPRFVLDNHLGRLAAYLRLAGMDCLYRNDFQDEELSLIAQEQERTLLTRDRRLLMRNRVRYGYCLRSTAPRQQLLEVAGRFRLARLAAPFQRCAHCNGLLQPVDKEAVLDRLEALTKQYFNEFRVCSGCGQIYWKGSHYQRVLGLLRQALPGCPVLEERLD
jgi:hypothetical protein